MKKGKYKTVLYGSILTGSYHFLVTAIQVSGLLGRPITLNN